MARRPGRSARRRGSRSPGTGPPAPDQPRPAAFTSDLTVEQFAAVRSSGFAVVGQVMGVAVFNIGQTYNRCGYHLTSSVGSQSRPRWEQEQVERQQERRAQQWQQQYARQARVAQVPDTQRLLTQARRQAVARMRQECAQLGGDGVVGARLTVAPFHDIGVEFCAIGTAVRARGTKRLKIPFTSDLSGQELAALLHAGWVPVAFVQGVGAVTGHRDLSQVDGDLSWYNQELAGPTKLVRVARRGAREALAAHAQQMGGHTVILRDSALQVSERHCTTGEGEDQFVNAFLWGTAIIPYAGKRIRRREPPLPIMRLNR